MTATDKLLMKLSNLDALPGQEAQVQAAMQETIQAPVTKDTFGNLYFGDLKTTKKKSRCMLIWTRWVFSSIA